MAELTTDPRRLSPALSSRRAGNGHSDPRRPAPVPREMTETGSDGSGGAALEQALQRALAAPAALTTALGLRGGRRATPLHYIDDSRYVLSAMEVSGVPRCSSGHPARDYPPRVFLTKAG